MHPLNVSQQKEGKVKLACLSEYHVILDSGCSPVSVFLIPVNTQLMEWILPAHVLDIFASQSAVLLMHPATRGQYDKEAHSSLMFEQLFIHLPCWREVHVSYNLIVHPVLQLMHSMQVVCTVQ